ncbi:hypothetical protein [Streptomyces monomycini]|uniref:hypothetical protein n=1 Tax=Streptomyces monomycini TaxID=371720 RepID=UPI0004AACF82
MSEPSARTTVRLAVVHYSSTGTVAGRAKTAAETAEKAGASVRLRKAAEPASRATAGARERHVVKFTRALEAGLPADG